MIILTCRYYCQRGCCILVLLETSGRLFGMDYQILFDAVISIFNILLLLVIFVIPITIIVILIRKLIKYLDAKTNYYNNINKDSLNDRQD
mgnify:CR=1 FL=1